MDPKIMFIISLAAGLLSTMNMWVVKWRDVRFHMNDVYMIFLMAGWMLSFSYLYHGNYGVGLMVALIIVTLSIIGIRQQYLVDDRQFLKGMIPHHSMAILMADKIRNKSSNEEIKKMADDIIETQTKEIEQMNRLLDMIA